VRLTKREELAATVDEVHALLVDRAFQEAKCAATTANGVYTVEVGGGPDGQRVHTERQLPSDGLPDMARSFVGDHLRVIEVLDWGAPTADGSRTAMVGIHVKGAPLTLKGTVRLQPHSTGTVEVIDAELKANVPLIGGKLERAAAEPIEAAIRIELDLLRTWLTR
jgi:hypothetical protein